MTCKIFFILCAQLIVVLSLLADPLVFLQSASVHCAPQPIIITASHVYDSVHSSRTSLASRRILSRLRIRF